MYLRLLLFCLLSLSLTTLQAQDSYRITIDIEGYESDILTLGYYLLDNQYIVDTASRSPQGDFVFASDTAALEKGIYLVVLSPDNNYFQLLIGDDDNQEFTVNTQVSDLNDLEIKGSEENELFYRYMAFLDQMTQLSQPIRTALSDSSLAPAASAQARQEMEALDERVKTYQADFVAEHPDAFVSAIIKANQSALPPDFPEVADDESRRELQWRWLQDHYFDNIDMTDERLLRTPFLFQRVDYYINTLQIKHPDTLAEAIDRVLAKFEPGSEAFKYFTVHYTNEAATSNIVGMDALYVHMIDNYYRSGKAYWTDETQLAKMVATAEKLRPLLLGKQAPDLHMTTRDGEPIDLYDIDDDYTVLYFWRYDCAACKKSTPHMKDFYNKWKDKGVTVFSVCTKGEDELGKCWEYVDENDTGDWVHVADPYQRYYQEYDIKSTPTIFLLDKDKTIVSKRISAEQLDEVLTALSKEKEATAAGK